jgi:hypothetical protein
MSIHYLNSHIPVKAYDTYERGVGLINDSRKARTTEIDALLRMLYGPGIAETDTIGEARRAGKCQCKRCLQYKEPSEYSRYKKGESEYQRPYCKPCRVAMERTKRFNAVEEHSPYPRRIE